LVLFFWFRHRHASHVDWWCHFPARLTHRVFVAVAKWIIQKKTKAPSLFLCPI
jgi:hypothetical protein